MEKNILRAVLLAALVCATSCLHEEALKVPFASYRPPELNDGWEVSTPEAERIDAPQLETIYRSYHQSDEWWQVRSLLVFRNGKLVAESYTKSEADRTEPRAVWSCTKQVMALLVGVAIERNLIGHVDDPIRAYLPDEAARYPDKGGVTIEQLLTMRSGIGFENDGLNGGSNMLLRQIPDNSLEFVLGLPIWFEPGAVFSYNDGDPHILSAVLQKQSGRTTRDWAHEVLCAKLELGTYDWVTYKDGITMGAFGMLITPRQMAKFGQLVLNKGVWNGAQVVARQWIETATTPKVSAQEVDLYGQSFGYYWWVDEDRGVVFMNGHGGQYVLVKPNKNLIVVVTAEPGTQGEHQVTMPRALALFDRIDDITYP